jgi:transcriptional regulator with XRE-family HTH domain
MAHERPESLPLGRLVVEQRHHLSLSQTDVVRRIHNAAKADGRQSGATKQWISEIERTGRIPHPDALRWLAAAIDLPVERVVAAAMSSVASVAAMCLADSRHGNKPWRVRHDCCMRPWTAGRRRVCSCRSAMA